MFFNRIVPVLENANKEIEYVFIVEVDNYDEVRKLATSVQSMEQWEIKSKHENTGTRGAVRVRAINNKEFMLGVKVYSPDGISADEHEISVSRDMFEAYKKLAPMGTKKRRYSIKDDGGLTWEVDVYTDENGNEIPWCKVDLEVRSKHVKAPNFPFTVKTVITNDRTRDEDLFVTRLFSTKFNIYNRSNILPVETYLDAQ